MLRLLTNNNIDHVTVENYEIISLIRKINPNKATGSAGISGQMVLLCDESDILPLEIFFQIFCQPPHTLICGNLLI